MPLKRTGETITRIVAKKSRVSVYFGTRRLILSENAFTDFALYVGKEVTPLEMRQIKSAQKSDTLLCYARRLFLRGSYSECALREKLKAKTDETEEIRKTIFSLKKDGFINDARYAQDYAEEYVARLYGAKKIKDDLRFVKGVSETIVESLVFPLDVQLKNAKTIVMGLGKRYANLSSGARSRKAFAYLLTRGYSPEVARQACAFVQSNSPSAENENLKKDLAKAYVGYARKYNGRELRDHLAAYLLRRGYHSGDVYGALEGMKK